MDILDSLEAVEEVVNRVGVRRNWNEVLFSLELALRVREVRLLPPGLRPLVVSIAAILEGSRILSEYYVGSSPLLPPCLFAFKATLPLFYTYGRGEARAAYAANLFIFFFR